MACLVGLSTLLVAAPEETADAGRPEQPPRGGKQRLGPLLQTAGGHSLTKGSGCLQARQRTLGSAASGWRRYVLRSPHSRGNTAIAFVTISPGSRSTRAVQARTPRVRWASGMRGLGRRPRHPANAERPRLSNKAWQCRTSAARSPDRRKEWSIPSLHRPHFILLVDADAVCAGRAKTDADNPAMALQTVRQCGSSSGSAPRLHLRQTARRRQCFGDGADARRRSKLRAEALGAGARVLRGALILALHLHASSTE